MSASSACSKTHHIACAKAVADDCVNEDAIIMKVMTMKMNMTMPMQGVGVCNFAVKSA